MEIIALQQYTDKYVSLYEGEIRNLEDKLANKLIEKNIVKQHTNSSDSSGSNAVMFIEFETYTPEGYQGDNYHRLNVTAQEIIDAIESGTIVYIKDNFLETDATIAYAMIGGIYSGEDGGSLQYVSGVQTMTLTFDSLNDKPHFYID